VRLLLGGTALAAVGAAASAVLLGPLDGRAEIAARASAEQVRALDQGHSMFGTTPTETWWWLAVDAPHSSTPPDLVHTTGAALALLGALLLAERYAGRLLLPLAAAGSMTLTLYTVHVWLLGTGWLPEDRETSYAVQVAAALLVASPGGASSAGAAGGSGRAGERRRRTSRGLARPFTPADGQHVAAVDHISRVHESDRRVGQQPLCRRLLPRPAGTTSPPMMAPSASYARKTWGRERNSSG
jgi:hypothetical protein